MVKQAQLEFDAQNSRDGLIHGGLGNLSAFYSIDDGVLKNVMVEIIELHVHAGIEREQDGIGGRIRDMMRVVKPADQRPRSDKTKP